MAKNLKWQNTNLTMEKKMEIGQYMMSLRERGYSKDTIVDLVISKYQWELFMTPEGKGKPGYINCYHVILAWYTLLYEM